MKLLIVIDMQNDFIDGSMELADYVATWRGEYSYNCSVYNQISEVAWI